MFPRSFRYVGIGSGRPRRCQAPSKMVPRPVEQRSGCGVGDSKGNMGPQSHSCGLWALTQLKHRALSAIRQIWVTLKVSVLLSQSNNRQHRQGPHKANREPCARKTAEEGTRGLPAVRATWWNMELLDLLDLRRRAGTWALTEDENHDESNKHSSVHTCIHI